MQNRRMFLQGGAALAVPVIGGALLGRDRTIVEAACPSCGDDPVSAEALRQFKSAVRALIKSAKGEHARRAAAALRIMAANGRSRSLDADVRRAIEREVSTYGRDNVLMRPFDREQFAATAREFGLEPAPDLSKAYSVAERQRAVDTLLSTGVTSQMDAAAAFFEAAGTELDAKRPVRRIQTKEEQIARCRGLQDYVFSTEVLMIAACLFSGPIPCAFFSGVYLGAKYYYEYETDCSRWL